MDLFKPTTSFGDVPDLFLKGAQDRNSLLPSLGVANAANTTNQLINIKSAAKINLETSFNDCERGYVPTVGRWGAEWPSWLSEASLVQHGAVGTTAYGVIPGLSAGAVRIPVGLTKLRPTVPEQDNSIYVQRTIGETVNSTTQTDDNHRHHESHNYHDDSSDNDENDAHNNTDGAVAIITETDNPAIAAINHSFAINDGLRNVHMTTTAFDERCNVIAALLKDQHHPVTSEQQVESWSSDDAYNVEAFKQINGIWPLGHPLPLPDWSTQVPQVLHFDNVWQYEDLNAIIEMKLHRLMEETHYDTVHLFTNFYKAFKRTRRSDLKSFFQFYDIPINRREHMCVSLAMEIMTRLIELFPILQHYLYIVSCEEQVVSVNEYIEICEEAGLNARHANLEKEHAMVAMKICIAGREGVVILDPGYHVSRAVTVMKDQLYPHTGWFTQSKEPNVQRDYCYNYSEDSLKYVEWKEREVRGDQTEYKSSLIYVVQAYTTAIDVTVRRNLVYNFRSLLSRDAKGRVFAGIYLPVVANSNEAHFTMFYDGPNDQRVRVKLLFNVFKNATKIPENVHQHLEKLAPQLRMSKQEVLEICKSLAEIVHDQDFISQLLAINEDIGIMSADNWQLKKKQHNDDAAAETESNDSSSDEK